jgi:hypothetical protein
MMFSEQQKMVEELRGYIAKMDRREREDFEMMVKRGKDDEQYDLLTQARLTTLHQKYVPRRSKADLDVMWKRMTGFKEKDGGQS